MQQLYCVSSLLLLSNFFACAMQQPTTSPYPMPMPMPMASAPVHHPHALSQPSFPSINPRLDTSSPALTIHLPLAGGNAGQVVSTHSNGNAMNAINTGDLAAVAPVAMAVYCYNQQPKLTLLALSALLLFILVHQDTIAKKVKKLTSQCRACGRVLRNVLYNALHRRYSKGKISTPYSVYR